MAKDGAPRVVPIAFTWNGAEVAMCTTTKAPKLASLRRNPVLAPTIEVRSLYDSMVRIVVTPTWAKLIDFHETLPSAVEELVRRRAERQSSER